MQIQPSDLTNEWTAVLIACGHDHLVGDRSAPLASVAGLTLIGRQVKTALHGGAARCCLVTASGSNAIEAEARSSWTHSDGFDIVRVDANISETDALLAAVSKEDQRVVTFFADVSFSRNLLQGLLQDGLGHRDALVAVGPAERWDVADSFHRPMGADGSRFAGLALLSGKLAREVPPGMTLAEALDAAGKTSGVRLRPMENSSTLRMRTREDLKLAEKLQLRALRRNNDGIVSRWLNRPVSLFLTRHLFLRLPLTPNHITFIAGVIGWVAIVIMFLWPGYRWVLLGAFLFHVSSVLDGCDGEVARLRFQFSRFGEWFDNVLDEFNNAAFIAGIGFGIFMSGGHAILAWAAGFYFLAIALCDSAVFYQLVRRRGGTGNFEKFRWFFEGEETSSAPNHTAYPPKRPFSAWLKELPRRDFYIFFLLILAAADLLVIGFWIAVATGVALFFLGAIQWIVQIRTRRT